MTVVVERNRVREENCVLVMMVEKYYDGVMNVQK